MKTKFNKSPKGKNHYNWKGGIADYPNHSLMKRNRYTRFKQTNGKCEVCGKSADQIHHKDENKSNHSLSNLAVLCKKCHGILHSNQPAKTSIYIRIYGMTLKSMSEKFGGTPSFYWKLHQKKNLTKFLNSQKEN